MLQQTNEDINIINITISMDVGSGDTRPLVRHLRMIAFFITGYLKSSSSHLSSLILSNSSQGLIQITINSSKIITLTHDEVSDNLFPTQDTPIYNTLANSISLSKTPKFRRIVDFFLSHTLTPAVVVSTSKARLSNLVDIISAFDGVNSIRGVNPDNYKVSSPPQPNPSNFHTSIISK